MAERPRTIRDGGSRWVVQREPARVVLRLRTVGYEDFAYRTKPRLDQVEATFQRMRRAAKAVGRLP